MDDKKDFFDENKNKDAEQEACGEIPLDSIRNTENGENKTENSKKRGIKTAIIISAVLVIALTLAIMLAMIGFDFLGIGFGRNGKSVTIEIPEGASTKKIADILEEAEVIKFSLAFNVYSRLKDYDSKYQYGVYTFNNDIGYSGVANKLVTEGKAADNVTVKIPEGATVDQIAELLEKNNVCTKKDFINSLQYDKFKYDFLKSIPDENVYYRLEGYLYPDTYNFYCYDSKECAYLAIDKMLSNLESKLDEKILKNIENGKYTFHEVMTMASIVELEASAKPEEMAKVAAVFYNRLDNPDKFPTLGSSPTIKYPHGNGRYNTYVSKGLPPGPLCSVSIRSIRAAADPADDFDYFYFVTDKSMKFYYNKTLSQHNSTIAKLKAENNWVYEYIE